MTSAVTTPITEPQDGLSAILGGTDIGSASGQDTASNGAGVEAPAEPQDGLGIALAASDIGQRTQETP